MFLLLGWILWKVVLALLFFRLLWAGTSGWNGGTSTSALLNMDTAYSGPTRILYIVTALAEYNTGRRATVKGQDRLGEILMPVLVDSVQSLVAFDYQVDVYLILGYTLRPERHQEIRNRLPAGVGLQVWDDAIPLGYPDAQNHTMEPNTRALSRQHRYVIKDKLYSYDLFMAFEDDMRITGSHVQALPHHVC